MSHSTATDSDTAVRIGHIEMMESALKHSGRLVPRIARLLKEHGVETAGDYFAQFPDHEDESTAQPSVYKAELGGALAIFLESKGASEEIARQQLDDHGSTGALAAWVKFACKQVVDERDVSRAAAMSQSATAIASRVRDTVPASALKFVDTRVLKDGEGSSSAVPKEPAARVQRIDHLVSTAQSNVAEALGGAKIRPSQRVKGPIVASLLQDLISLGHVGPLQDYCDYFAPTELLKDKHTCADLADEFFDVFYALYSITSGDATEEPCSLFGFSIDKQNITSILRDDAPAASPDVNYLPIHYKHIGCDRCSYDAFLTFLRSMVALAKDPSQLAQYLRQLWNKEIVLKIKKGTPLGPQVVDEILADEGLLVLPEVPRKAPVRRKGKDPIVPSEQREAPVEKARKSVYQEVSQRARIPRDSHRRSSAVASDLITPEVVRRSRSNSLGNSPEASEDDGDDGFVLPRRRSSPRLKALKGPVTKYYEGDREAAIDAGGSQRYLMAWGGTPWATNNCFKHNSFGGPKPCTTFREGVCVFSHDPEIGKIDRTNFLGRMAKERETAAVKKVTVRGRRTSPDRRPDGGGTRSKAAEEIKKPSRSDHKGRASRRSPSESESSDSESSPAPRRGRK